MRKNHVLIVLAIAAVVFAFLLPSAIARPGCLDVQGCDWPMFLSCKTNVGCDKTPSACSGTGDFWCGCCWVGEYGDYEQVMCWCQ